MLKRFILAVVVFAVAPAAMAQNPARGWYVGADAGIAELEGDIEYLDDEIDFKDQSRVITLHAGYRFNRVVSLGMFASDYGSYSESRDGYSSDSNVSAFGVQFTGRVPVGEKVGILGTVMAFFHDVDFTTRVPDGTVYKADGGGLNTRFGLGANYQFNPNVDLRLELQQTRGVNHGFMTFDVGQLRFDGKLTSLTLGLRYKF